MKNTLIWCITLLICTIIICLTLYTCFETNRYASYDGYSIPAIIDQKTGIIYSLNTSKNICITTDFKEGTETIKKFTSAE